MQAIRARPESEARDAEADFVAELRAFLKTALTADLRAAGRNTVGFHAPIWASKLWHQRLYERGWIAPTWPKAYGGAEWSARQRYIWDRECAENDAPVLFSGGVRSLGPLLIEQGDEAQKARYLKPILTGDDIWAQGFSEPGAGSDLAAVVTEAHVEGDDYVITGTKIWTTGAQYCNRMFALVRTGHGRTAREGLTFLLLDMDAPGLSMRPIADLNGRREFNAVFFDRVRTRVANRVGEEGQGWKVATRLMQLARSNNTPSGVVRRTLRRAELALAGLDEPGLRSRLFALKAELLAYEGVEQALLGGGRISASDPKASSMIKLMGTELNQRASELVADARGVTLAEAFEDEEEGLSDASHAVARYFDLRAASIYSGSSEIHRNLIARQLVG